MLHAAFAVYLGWGQPFPSSPLQVRLIVIDSIAYVFRDVGEGVKVRHHGQAPFQHHQPAASTSPADSSASAPAARAMGLWHLQVEELSQRASLLFKLSATLKVSDRRFVSRPAQSRQQQQPLVN